MSRFEEVSRQLVLAVQTCDGRPRGRLCESIFSVASTLIAEVDTTGNCFAHLTPALEVLLALLAKPKVLSDKQLTGAAGGLARRWEVLLKKHEAFARHAEMRRVCSEPVPPHISDALSAQVMDLFAALRPKPQGVALKRALLQRMQRICQGSFPGSQLLVYGSSGSLFGFDSSDMDLCLNLTQKQLEAGRSKVGWGRWE